MLTKKLLISLLLLITAMSTESLAKNIFKSLFKQPVVYIPVVTLDCLVIKGATYFKLHQPDECRLSEILGYRPETFLAINPFRIPAALCKSGDCSENMFISHKNAHHLITFHDISWKVIAMVDAGSLNLSDAALYEYAISRLDTTSKLKVMRVKIRAHPASKKMQGHEILFYDKRDNLLLSDHWYYGSCSFDAKDRAYFEKYLDFSDLKKIEYKSNKKKFLIF